MHVFFVHFISKTLCFDLLKIEVNMAFRKKLEKNIQSLKESGLNRKQILFHYFLFTHSSSSSECWKSQALFPYSIPAMHDTQVYSM